MVKPEKFGLLHLVYHFTVPLMTFILLDSFMIVCFELVKLKVTKESGSGYCKLHNWKNVSFNVSVKHKKFCNSISNFLLKFFLSTLFTKEHLKNSHVIQNSVKQIHNTTKDGIFFRKGILDEEVLDETLEEAVEKVREIIHIVFAIIASFEFIS